MSAHTAACWATPDCTVCGRRKAPRGRSVPLAVAGGYCGNHCDGYYADPKPGHFWPEEEPELRASVSAHPLADAFEKHEGEMGAQIEPDPTPGEP